MHEFTALLISGPFSGDSRWPLFPGERGTVRGEETGFQPRPCRSCPILLMCGASLPGQNR